jgi:hypothetical protein
MALRAVVEDIEAVPESLRDEYIERDGKWVLGVDGDLPGYVRSQMLADTNAKLAEFRDNNTKLLKRVDELEPLRSQLDELHQKLKTFEGIDPQEYMELKKRPPNEDNEAQLQKAVQAAVAPLQKRVEELTERERAAEERERRAAEMLARKTLEGELTQIGLELGVDERAIPDYVRRGLEIFRMDDGQIVAMNGDTPVYSPMNPTAPLTVEEWAQGLMDDAPHLFKGSGGGGAEPDRDTRPAPRKQIENDPLEFGRNLEGIARGDVRVRGGA